MEVIIKANGESLIGLTLEEYNELLIIKGKYQELKQLNTKEITWDPIKYPWIVPTLTKTTDPLPETPYKITCTN